MSKPRIRVINRHGFTAYMLISNSMSPYVQSSVWMGGKRYISNGYGNVYFSPGDQPTLKPRLSDLAGLVRKVRFT